MEIMGDIFKYLADNFSKGTNSNKTGSTMHKMIKQKTGCDDPYFREKIEGNEIALKYLPDVKKILKEDDSLENYVKIAIIGNILDFGAFTLDDDIYAFLKAQETKKPIKLCCAIGDTEIDGKPYSEIVEIARNYIKEIGGFEKFACWGLF